MFDSSTPKVIGKMSRRVVVEKFKPTASKDTLEVEKVKEEVEELKQAGRNLVLRTVEQRYVFWKT